MGNLRFVFTGGPGVGKTATLTELESRGYRIVADSARQVIIQRKAAGLSPRPEPGAVETPVLDMDIVAYRKTPADAPVFFERGVVDSVHSGADGGRFSPTVVDELIDCHRYNSTVFLFPPWRAIYRTDTERDHTFEHSVNVYETIRHWYPKFGYRFLEVPKGDIGSRADFIVQALDSVTSE